MFVLGLAELEELLSQRGNGCLLLFLETFDFFNAVNELFHGVFNLLGTLALGCAIVVLHLPFDECADVILELFVLEVTLVNVMAWLQLEVGAEDGSVEEFVAVELLDFALVVNVFFHKLVKLLEPEWEQFRIFVAQLAQLPG